MTANEVALITELINKVDGRVTAVDTKVDDVATDVKELVALKWQIIGGAVAASALIGFATQVALAWSAK